MSEERPDPEEFGALEHIPTSEEVHEVFRLLIKDGREYAVTKELYDEKGLYELEIQMAGETPVEITEYQYRRFKFPDVPEIHVAFYEDEMPVGGTSAARYINGEWKFF